MIFAEKFNKENLMPFIRKCYDFCRKILQFIRNILRFWQENLTIFVEKCDGLYKSVHPSMKNIIFNHISYFLIVIKKTKRNMDYNR